MGATADRARRKRRRPPALSVAERVNAGLAALPPPGGGGGRRVRAGRRRPAEPAQLVLPGVLRDDDGRPHPRDLIV